MLRLDINLVFTILNILIWYGIIRIFLFKPVNNIIKKREDAINASYEQAENAKKAALEEKKKYEVCQAQIEEEKKKAIEEAQETARAEYQQIVDDAHKQAGNIVADAKKAAQLEREKNVGRFEQEIKSLLIDAAAKSMNNADDGKLYNQFLDKAGETPDA